MRLIYVNDTLNQIFPATNLNKCTFALSKRFFHGIPVIYESVWSRTLAELAGSLGMTGVLGHSTIMDNLDLAVKMNPNAIRILAISDQSAVGHAMTTRLKAIRSRYAPMDVKRENELRQTSNLLKTEAEIDALTQIGNRRLFERELLRTIQAKRPFTLYMIDIDDFKKINDTFGHPAGDAVLYETGRRLNALKTRAFVPYRYGGDEFTVMEFSENASVSGNAGSEIQKLFLPEIVTENRRIQVRISLGSADYPEDAANPEELIHNADKALYLAKTSGKSKAVRHCERNASRL